MSQLRDQLEQGIVELEEWKHLFTQTVAQGGDAAGVAACPLKMWVEKGIDEAYKSDPRFNVIMDLNQRVQHEAMRILMLAKEDRIDEAMVGLQFSGTFYNVLSQLTNELMYWKKALNSVV